MKTWPIDDSLNERVQALEKENIETTNVLYEVLNQLDLLETKMFYDLTTFEKGLSNFANRIGVIVNLEIGDKISSEEAYSRIKEEYKKLKKLHKQNDV
jgi:hypothetical protein